MVSRKRPSVITLITDFGMQDEYVGVVKGILLRHAPKARIIDISNLIPRHAIATASHLLSRSYSYFPEYTVHLVVVDPGVGSTRRMLAVKADDHFFVGPDNGVFTALYSQAASITVHQISEDCSLPGKPCTTFHGRDIMAPAAGRLALSRDISQFGPRIALDDCRRLLDNSCIRLAETIHGAIVHIDTFGNLCTNIMKKDIDDFAAGRKVFIQVTKDRVIELHTTYADCSKGDVLALYESHNHLEIAVNQGDAAHLLQLKIGSPVIVSRQPW